MKKKSLKKKSLKNCPHLWRFRRQTAMGNLACNKCTMKNGWGWGKIVF